MALETLEADYLVIGAGAMGLAFVDELLTRCPNESVVLVERRAKPGGHWNDAYPFVSLHQPAAYYGVNSEPLGTGGASLATVSEVLAYFERVLAKLVASGRVRFYSMCAYEGDGTFRSIVAPDTACRVAVKKKTVDSTYMNVEVPSTTPPKYEVAPEAALVPLNDLVRVRTPRDGYVIVGAGKTGIDAVLFLMQQGVGPECITWIMPNDSWLMERAGIQPGRTLDWFDIQNDVLLDSDSVEEIYLALEREKIFFRIDEKVWPKKFRCATVNREELAQLRRVENIVRLGRVVRIGAEEIELEEGTIATSPGALHVDCTADPLAKRAIRPVFDGSTITLQSLFMCQQVFSASLIGYVESQYDDEAEKNALCQPVPHPEFCRDYVAAQAVTGANMFRWGRAFPRWMRQSRLAFIHHESALTVYKTAFKAWRIEARLTEKCKQLYAQEFPGEPFPVADSA